MSLIVCFSTLCRCILVQQMQFHPILDLDSNPKIEQITVGLGVDFLFNLDIIDFDFEA